MLRDVSGRRAVIPIIWAQHDDGQYLCSYPPLAEFYAKLADAGASGFGVIHWTTRPLDLFFVSHAKQVWRSTRDQPLRATCDEMAAKSFGPVAGRTMGEYLEQWITTAPRFGRETLDQLIDRKLTNVAEVVAGCRRRTKLLESAALLPPYAEQRRRPSYFTGLERFIADFYQTQERFQNAEAALGAGDLNAARAAMAACRPERVVEQYAKSVHQSASPAANRDWSCR